MRERWHPDKENTALEIYYHPEHTFNLARMMNGMKQSLDYYNKNFTPINFNRCVSQKRRFIVEGANLSPD